SVKDLFVRRAGEQRRQRLQIWQGERVDQRVLGGGGELQQAQPLTIRMQAVGFRIYGNQRLFVQSSGQRSQRAGGCDQGRCTAGHVAAIICRKGAARVKK